MNSHVRIFAILGVGISFGLAMFGLVKLFPFNSNVAGAHNYKRPSMYTARDFNECVQLRGSINRDSYPPVCITKEGNKFTKNVPAIKWPEEQRAPQMNETKEVTDTTNNENTENTQEDSQPSDQTDLQNQ